MDGGRIKTATHARHVPCHLRLHSGALCLWCWWCAEPLVLLARTNDAASCAALQEGRENHARERAARAPQPRSVSSQI